MRRTHDLYVENPSGEKNHWPYRLGQQTTKHYIKESYKQLTTLPSRNSTQGLRCLADWSPYTFTVLETNTPKPSSKCLYFRGVEQSINPKL